MGLSVGAQAQQTGYVDGIYVGLAGGFNLRGNEVVKNVSPNFGAATPAGSLSTLNSSTFNIKSGIGGAGVANVGWGFGNGLRAELEFDYRSGGYSKGEGGNSAGFQATTADGSEKLFGPMVNVYYDFVGLSPYVVPYVGIGIGAQWARLNNFTIPGSVSGVAVSPTLTASGTQVAFAAQGILGLGFPIPQVPGLSATAEYRIMGVTNNRGYDATLTATGPGGGTASTKGSLTIGREWNNTFLFGVRYALWTPPPPPPAPLPVAAPAPAPSRSYLVFFDWDKATLTDRARQIIKSAADNSTHVQYTRIEVDGYTDTSGTPAYNKGLSIRRANAVATELVADGVPKNVITAQGFGETHLLVPTADGVREPQNRRVEIVIR
jgi:hypothetical protein